MQQVRDKHSASHARQGRTPMQLEHRWRVLASFALPIRLAAILEARHAAPVAPELSRSLLVRQHVLFVLPGAFRTEQLAPCAQQGRLRRGEPLLVLNVQVEVIQRRVDLQIALRVLRESFRLLQGWRSTPAPTVLLDHISQTLGHRVVCCAHKERIARRVVQPRAALVRIVPPIITRAVQEAQCVHLVLQERVQLQDLCFAQFAMLEECRRLARVLTAWRGRLRHTEPTRVPTAARGAGAGQKHRNAICVRLALTVLLWDLLQTAAFLARTELSILNRDSRPVSSAQQEQRRR